MTHKLNLMTAVGKTGYGIVGRNILCELVKQNVDTSLFLIGHDAYADDQQSRSIIEQSMGNGRSSFDYNAKCLKIWHQFDLATRVGNGEYAAFPIFELDNFAQNEIHHLNYPDKIIVCSNWAKQIIERYIKDKPVGVVPLGIDPSIFCPKPKQNNKTYTFIHIGKWEKRKGHDIIVELFNNAFTAKDNVELWLMPFNPFITKEEHQEWVSLYKNSNLGDKIHIFPYVNTHKELANIISRADCGIFPAHAEGWNLELLEVMSMGKPVITTNYSGHTEFCTKNNSYLVDIDKVEPAFDGKWFFRQGNWAAIEDNQKEQFIEHMRYVYENRPHNQEGINTGKIFTWKNSVKCLLKFV